VQSRGFLEGEVSQLNQGILRQRGARRTLASASISASARCLLDLQEGEAMGCMSGRATSWTSGNRKAVSQRLEWQSEVTEGARTPTPPSLSTRLLL
jgi:hypothetical protein